MKWQCTFVWSDRSRLAHRNAKEIKYKREDFWSSLLLSARVAAHDAGEIGLARIARTSVTSLASHVNQSCREPPADELTASTLDG